MGALGALFAMQAGASISSGVSNARAARAAGEYEARGLEFNARLADMAAEDAAKKRGETEAREHTRKAKRLIGDQRAALAAQGIDPDSGSALDLQIDSRSAGEADALTIRNNAWREAMGFKIQAMGYRSQAGLARTAGKAAARQSLLTGGIQALTAGTSYKTAKT